MVLNKYYFLFLWGLRESLVIAGHGDCSGSGGDDASQIQ